MNKLQQLQAQQDLEVKEIKSIIRDFPNGMRVGLLLWNEWHEMVADYKRENNIK